MNKCFVIGDPVAHSLSPAMHTAGYNGLGIDSDWSFEARQITEQQLPQFMSEVREQNIRGVSCTTPHKQNVMELLDELDETAQKIGAVNTVVNDDGKLVGYNTDWQGIVLPLLQLTPLQGKRVALLGAGGAARAAAYGLAKEGADVVVYNRTEESGKLLAEEFGLKFEGELSDAGDAQVVINTTTVGMSPLDEVSVLPSSCLNSEQIVFDIIYHPLKTKLLRDAEDVGAKIIFGTEMLLQQGAAQFTLYTGKKAPLEDMRQAITNAL